MSENLNNYKTNLVEQFPVTKTLTVELKPVGYTAEVMSYMFSDMDNSIISIDKIRSEKYPAVKLLLDEYYRFAVQKILESYQFEDTKMESLYDTYTKLLTCETETEKKTYKEKLIAEENKLCKSMAEYSKKILSKLGLDKYSELFKPDSVFMKWVDTQKDAKELKNILNLYESSLSYFTKYKTNREVLFADKMTQGSICTRSIENMEIFFENIEYQKDVCNKHPGLAEKMKITRESLEELRKSVTMHKFFSPHGIFTYNNTVVADYNMAVNEYVQQNKIVRDKPQYLKKLYKQILFESEKAFTVYSIKDTEELQRFICAAYDNYNNAVGYLQPMMNILMESPAAVYFKTARLTSLCKSAYKIPEAYNVFSNCFSLYLDASKTKKERAELEKKYKKEVSFEDIISIINTYRAEIEAYNGIKGENVLMDFVERAKSLPRLTHSFEISKGVVPDEIIMELQEALTVMNDNLAKHRHFIIPEDREKETNNEFYNIFSLYMDEVNAFNNSYNLIRNYLTKKNEKDAKKIPISFNINGLMGGMSVSSEIRHRSFMLKKDGVYYLCIIPKGMTPRKLKITEGADKNGNYYEKLIYQIAKDAYMSLPAKYFQKKCNVSEELQYIKDNKLYTKEADDKKSMRKMIEYYLHMLHSDEEWNAYFDFSSLKTAEEYDTIVDFYNDVDKCTTLMKFIHVPASQIEEHVAAGRLYMFQLYRKDFKEQSKGKKDLFTMYLDAVFSAENVKETNRPHITINGGSTLFYQPAKQDVEVIHPAGIPIENKKAINGKTHSVFSYDIVKDRHLTRDKLVLNIPMTFNAHTSGQKYSDFNSKVNEMVENNEFDHMIAVTRSFRNLLYYRITDFKGNLVEQGSLNVINGTDYYKKLDETAKQRIEQTKNWTQRTSIKNIKDGYISQVVCKLSELVLKYNAILIIDRYSSSERNKNFALEKTLFKSFEEKLINKLSYLVLKDADIDAPGSALHPYQFAQPADFLEHTKQSGIIYFVNAYGTGNTDPETGYVSQLYFKYKNRKSAAKEVEKFNYVMYDKSKDSYLFNCSYSNFGINDNTDKNKWSLYVHGKRHHIDNAAQTVKEKYKEIDLDLQLKNLFAKYDIHLEPGKEYSMQTITCNKNVDAGFYKSLFFIFNLAFKLRFIDYMNEQDYAVSPVEKDGVFFRTASETEYPCHDAVKAEMLRRRFEIS